MFRFTIRDLLWLTLVVALTFGWFVREERRRAEVSQVASERDQASERATKWRDAAKGLAKAMTKEGWLVGWEVDPADLESLQSEGGMEEFVPTGIAFINKPRE
jgi:hypothetical protein